MNLEVSEMIISLKRRIDELVSLYKSLGEEKESLIQEKILLEEKVANLSKEKEELEHHYKLLKFAKTISATGKGSDDAKFTINQIVREIDNCIALLNK